MNLRASGSPLVLTLNPLLEFVFRFCMLLLLLLCALGSTRLNLKATNSHLKISLRTLSSRGSTQLSFLLSRIDWGRVQQLRWRTRVSLAYFYNSPKSFAQHVQDGWKVYLTSKGDSEDTYPRESSEY